MTKTTQERIERAATADDSHLATENARYREALEEIATGKNKAGYKVDFYQDIAQQALNGEATNETE